MIKQQKLGTLRNVLIYDSMDSMAKDLSAMDYLFKCQYGSYDFLFVGQVGWNDF